MSNQTSGNPGVDRDRVVALVARLKAVKPGGDEQNQILDELQDVVGLAGKMVMEKDILRRAQQIIGA